MATYITQRHNTKQKFKTGKEDNQVISVNSENEQQLSRYKPSKHT
jgi:hypothetical protein